MCSGGLVFVSGREDLSAGRNTVDCSGYADIGHELHHDLDEFFPCDTATERAADIGPQLWRRASKRRQRRDGDDLPRARAEHGGLVDVSVERFEHIGCELWSHVAERPFDLIRGLSEDLIDFLCAAPAAPRVRLHCRFLSAV